MISKHTPGRAHAAPGSLRIIGGRWRGRKLRFPSLAGLRPTGDRVRETLFNWITPFVVDAHCLDLFAGSGALGLEAVSRGAASVTLVELSPDACKALRAHTLALDAGSQVQVVQGDARQWLTRPPPRAFDMVFLDPPFSSTLLTEIIPLLGNAGWLSSGARIYVETERAKTIALPDNWQLLRCIETGQVRCQLLQSNDVHPINRPAPVSASGAAR